MREISSSDRVIKITVPSALESHLGTLVYREREDGGAQVIGRVIAVEPGDANQVELSIRLVAAPSGQSSRGGTIKGAPATLDLRWQP